MSKNGWWSRLIGRFQRSEAGVVRDDLATSVSHLEEFVLSRAGVEMWVEAPTQTTRPSVLLVAKDGESTRRTVPSMAWGHEFAATMKIPAYDAGVVGYPQRMREWNRRQRG